MTSPAQTRALPSEIETLFELEKRRIYLLALRLTTDSAAAEDVLQEAFLRAWRSWDEFRGDSSRSTWVCGIAIRCALNMLRRERSILEFARQEASRDDRHVRRPASEERVDLERAIAHLPDKARAVFVLRDVEGFSTAEVAQLLAIAPGTVKAHLFHARRQLASTLSTND